MRRIAPVLVVLGALYAGCGGHSLTRDEQLDVHEAEVAFTAVVVDGSHYGAALDGVDRVVALYRAKPDAKYENDPDKADDDLTMRQVVEDAASELDEYQPDMAAKLDRALR